ncbi:protogenin B-like [Sitophilus oryzae]|uniref:Protogenin B-like n=1 Tax=Sitophilus oryzae TaxID=7048 RepID=A0A6J2XZ30_SITOR|nr:protogenin B-like [Sitophilus oryzae]
MAMRTFQLCLVFAVGYFVQRASALLGANRPSLPIDNHYPQHAPSYVRPQQQQPSPDVSLRFVEEPSDVVTPRNRDVTLRCACVSTRGNASVTWLYEGRSLFAEDGPAFAPGLARWRLEEGGVALRLLRVAGGGKRAGQGGSGGGNAGEYACLARNEVGAVMSRTARVRLATMDKDVTALTYNLTIYETQPILLHCSVHSTPPAEIQWEFNQLPLPKDKRYVPLPDGSLLIRNTKLSDTGNYRCIAENIILKKTKYSKDVEISVVPLTVDSIPPTIMLVNSSVNKSALDGEAVDFICIASGYPLPTVQWLNSSNAVISNSSTLTIRKVHPKDSGNYTCVAKNPNGQARQRFSLEVHQKPFFNATPTSKRLPSAKTVRLDCQAKGVPQPRVYWLKDGQPVTIGGRIKKQWTGLVFSHTFTTDSGIYQCVAVNSVGKISTAAQVEINNSESPSPPQNVKCRPFDSERVCITWKSPPNVSAQAYSVYSYFTKDGEEMAGPEFLVTETFLLTEGLKTSTNYTFYVRLYSKHASDRSDKITCQTGLKESRNLDIDVINSTTLVLKWNKLSSDVLCNGTKDPYVVEWYREGDEKQITSEITMERKLIVTDLIPSTDYQFRVTTENNAIGQRDASWTMYIIPDLQDAENGSSDTSSELRAPKYLHEISSTSTSTKISWDRVAGAKFYTVCYVPAKENRDCEEDDFIRSYSPKFSVSKLTPNTDYLFKVRAHDANNVSGAISNSLKIHTLADVPSLVEDLEYKTINSSAACVYWRPPKNHYGNLKSYVISYTIDPNLSLENLIEYNVSISHGKSQFCWKDSDENGEIWSTLLTNLSTQHTYLVMVRAVNDFGVGQPLVTRLDIPNKASEVEQDEALHNRKVGIILGVVLALICIWCCIAFILLRRRCIKRRAVARERLAVSSNYRPAVAHYMPHVGTVQVRMEQPCTATEHEIEQLVPEEQTSHIPPITPDHLDTKSSDSQGANDFPNGHVNGTNNKRTHMNGAVLNGNVHITENPQYYAYESRGKMAKNKSEPLLRHYVEDSNSNSVKPSKFYDFLHLLDHAVKPKPSSIQDEGASILSNGELSPNTTQLTILEDSLNNGAHRRLSPVLEPNG